MTKEQILQSEELKEIFVRDNGLPITVLKEPYFSQRLIILDPLFHCRMAFKRFCEELSRHSSAEGYLAYRERTVAAAQIGAIENGRKAFEDLNTEYFDKLLGGSPVLLGGDEDCDLYSFRNSGKFYLRVSLRNGYLTAIHRFAPQIIKADSWNELFEDIDSHLCDSLLVQHRFYAMLGVGRLAQLTQCFLSIEAEKIGERFGIEPRYAFPGELLYELDRDSNLRYSDLRNVLDPTMSAEIFRLIKLESVGFMEDYIAGSKIPVRFVSVDPNIYHQLVTYYFRDILMSDDLVINYNGQLATMHEPIQNPFQIRAL